MAGAVSSPDVATLPSADLFPEAGNPDGSRVVNERCLVRTQDGHRVVIVAGMILAQYALSDRMSETL